MNTARADAPSSSPEKRPLVYVVDDEPLLLDLAKIILEPLGVRVETYPDPISALRAFKAANPPPDLIVTDYSMSGSTGMDLLAACRKTYPLQKVLLLSGTVQERVYEGATSKPDAFLAKPYQASELVEAVKALLHR